MAAIKFKSEEEFEAFKKKADAESPRKEPANQNIKTSFRPDQTSSEKIPREQSERAELNRKLREAQEEKETTFAEKTKEAIKKVGDKVKEKFKQSPESEKEEPVDEEEEEEEEDRTPPKKSKPSKKSKKIKDIDMDMESDFDGGDEPSGSGDGRFTKDYKEVYSGKKVMSGEYKNVYNGHIGSETYNPPLVPKTHGNFLREPSPRRNIITKPMPMPRVGNFRGNIAMPTITLGRNKMSGGNTPSINIPTLGKSTLMVGTGLMGKSANNKMGISMGDIPRIGNWGKAPLKTKLETPSIGNLTIMGAGKGSVKFGLGEVPSFGLNAPVKRKKV